MDDRSVAVLGGTLLAVGMVTIAAGNARSGAAASLVGSQVFAAVLAAGLSAGWATGAVSADFEGRLARWLPLAIVLSGASTLFAGVVRLLGTL